MKKLGKRREKGGKGRGVEGEVEKRLRGEMRPRSGENRKKSLFNESESYYGFRPGCNHIVLIVLLWLLHSAILTMGFGDFSLLCNYIFIFATDAYLTLYFIITVVYFACPVVEKG